ncbi:MAG: CoA-binding protein [Dehalococcoidia bacterium]|nr:CoA-binding protein [Dehalococcoidia bacterium]
MTFPANRKGLDFIFYPESLAIVGVSTAGAAWHPGTMYFESLHLFGYRGRIYLVNRKGGDYRGIRLYSSLIDLPETPQLVFCCIARDQIPGLIDECVAKGVKAVSIFTGGFSERTGEEGRRLEAEIVDRARVAGIRVLGPNCLGPFCPEVGLSPGTEFPQGSGPVGLISQSGGNLINFVRSSAQRGIRLNKGISYGNASDVNETELLEYMVGDPGITMVAMYLEGVRDGRRFFRTLREVAVKKPIAIFKGGSTEAGARTAASHSGSLAGTNYVWEALFRQTGTIGVDSLEELIDVTVAFRFLPPLKGRRVGLVGMTGGATVQAADDCARGGLVLPRVSHDIEDELRRYFNNDPGLILHNPIDESTHGFTDGIYGPLKIMQRADVDLLLVHIPMGMFLLPKAISEVSSLKLLVSDVIRIHKEGGLPMAVVISHTILPETRLAALECQEVLASAGLPGVNSVAGAARAIDRFIRYHEWRRRHL